MKVYGNAVSGGTRLVLMALAEKNAQHDFISLDFAKGDHKQPVHVARQPFGKLPAVEHDGMTLFESRAIARYIDEAFPGERFLPADVKERALMDQWINVELTEFTPHAHPLVLEMYFKEAWGMGKPDMEKVETLRKKLGVTLAVLDKALDGKSYLVGNKFTLADMVYMPDLEYLYAAGEGDWIGKFANVGRWWKGLSGRKSWVTATAKSS